MTLSIFSLCLHLSSCAGRKGESVDSQIDNYAVESALINALREEEKIHREIAQIVSAVSSGTIDFETSFDSLVERTDKILSLIDSISKAGMETDKKLGEARERVNVYLRERIHQIENCLSATSPADLQTKFLESDKDLESLKKKVVDKLMEYNPDIGKELSSNQRKISTSCVHFVIQINI